MVDKKLLEEMWKMASADENMWRHDTWLDGDEGKDIILSILACALLRHSGTLVARGDGYVSVRDLLEHECMIASGLEATKEDLFRIIENDNGKKRLGTKLIDGVEMIRANQAHSISAVQDEKLCGEAVTPSNLPKILYHATNAHEKIESAGGLKTMGRNHIHFAPENPSVHLLCGAETMVLCDSVKASNMGIFFFVSENGVVLSRGLNGTIPVECLSFSLCQADE